MLYPTHMIAGGAAGLAVARCIGSPPATLLLLGGAGAIGALFPDLDSPRAASSRILCGLGMTTTGAALLLETHGGLRLVRPSLELLSAWGALCLGILLVPHALRRWTGHRGATHSVLCASTLTLIAILIALVLGATPIVMQAIAVVGVGWIAGGIGGDACTMLGVPALWPWRAEKKHILPPRWRIVTGSWHETNIVRPLVVVAAVLALVLGH